MRKSRRVGLLPCVVVAAPLAVRAVAVADHQVVGVDVMENLPPRRKAAINQNH
jgi:hypothetical protein